MVCLTRSMMKKIIKNIYKYRYSARRELFPVPGLSSFFSFVECLVDKKKEEFPVELAGSSLLPLESFNR